MIHTLALTKEFKLLFDISIDRLFEQDIQFYWVDFDAPTETETSLLSKRFNFNNFAIEDCINSLQRPKLDYYNDYNFFVLHALNEETLSAEEIDVFLSDNFIVTYHMKASQEIRDVQMKLRNANSVHAEGINYIFYKILDEIVDNYFPVIYKIEDRVEQLGMLKNNTSFDTSIKEVFDVRTDLLTVRHIANSMRDLLYRIIESNRLEGFKELSLHYGDIYDHLIKISDMVVSAQDLTSDIRDTYMSLSSNLMNKRMTVLTVITSIFAPLTFIAGIYGMNFRYMPELELTFGYYIIMIVMFLIGAGMCWWFVRKGWLDVLR